MSSRLFSSTHVPYSAGLASLAELPRPSVKSISAFASTSGTLAALVTFAVPLAASGTVPGVAFICALAVCASLVDMCPLSPNGATLVATSDEEQRPRMTSLLTRWGLAMTVLGPLVLGGGLVWLS